MNVRPTSSMSPRADPAMPSFAAIDAERLEPWITKQRWFASKGRIGHIGVVDTVPLCDEPPLALALIEARPLTDTGPGATELYQLLVGTEWVAGIASDALDDPSESHHAGRVAPRRAGGESDETCVQFHWSPERPSRPAATRPSDGRRAVQFIVADRRPGRLEAVPASRTGDQSGAGDAAVPAYARVHRCA